MPLLHLRGEALGQPTVRSFAPPGLEVSGLAFDGQSLWVTVDGGRGIHAVDPESGRIRRSLPFAVRDTAGSAWDGRLLWQLAYEQKLLLAIDPATGVVVRRMRSPGQGMCSGMTYDGQHLWVANFEDRKLYRIDQRGDGRVLRTLPTEQETCGIAWDGRRLWAGVILGVSDHGAPTPQTGFVYERDLDSGQILRVLHVAGVGPGTSDWPWGPADRRRFWWYDGHAKRIVWYDLRP